MHHVYQALEAGSDLPRLETVDAVDLVRPPLLAGSRVPFPVAEVGHALSLRQAGLTPAQSLLVLLALRDVADDGEYEGSVGFFRIADRGDWAEAHLDGDLLAPLAYGGEPQQPVGVDVDPTARLPVAGQPRHVPRTQALGDKRLDA